MGSIHDILDKAGQIALESIKSTFNEKNLNDTFRGRDSITYKVKGKTLIIEGLARVLFLQFGRRPGVMPPIAPIQKWAESKLGVSPEESKGVAFAIAKKMAEEGTEIFKNREKGLEIQLTLAMMNKILIKEITNSISLEITGGLASLWEGGKSPKILE